MILQSVSDSSISAVTYRSTHIRDIHSLAYKVSVVRTLYSRALAISLSVLNKDEETKHIKQTLTTNSYPKIVILSVPTNSWTAYQVDTQGPNGSSISQGSQRQ